MSNKKQQVKCSSGISSRCRGAYLAWTKNLKRRGAGLPVVCNACNTHRETQNKASPDLDDDFFREIDTEDKAYILGIIASDGSVSPNGVFIGLRFSDRHILARIGAKLSRGIKVRTRPQIKALWEPISYISISSTQISKDICRHLSILPKKKSHVVKYPTSFSNEELHRAFVRGLMDGGGHIPKLRNGDKKGPRCGLTSHSVDLLLGVQKRFGGKLHFPKKSPDKAPALEWTAGTEALDFLDKLYAPTFSGSGHLYLSRKRDLYIDICVWQPSLTGSGSKAVFDGARFCKTRKNATLPSKARASDSGYDLSIIEKAKTLGAVELYDTGIKVTPPPGYYFDLVARSSITKTGYMLANGIGVIDRSYVGPVLVPLIKVDPNAPELELPLKVVQLIPRPIVHVRFVEVDSLDETDRGAGGFGSTGR